MFTQPGSDPISPQPSGVELERDPSGVQSAGISRRVSGEFPRRPTISFCDVCSGMHPAAAEYGSTRCMIPPLQDSTNCSDECHESHGMERLQWFKRVPSSPILRSQNNELAKLACFSFHDITRGKRIAAASYETKEHLQSTFQKLPESSTRWINVVHKLSEERELCPAFSMLQGMLDVPSEVLDEMSNNEVCRQRLCWAAETEHSAGSPWMYLVFAVMQIAQDKDYTLSVYKVVVWVSPKRKQGAPVILSVVRELTGLGSDFPTQEQEVWGDILGELACVHSVLRTASPSFFSLSLMLCGVERVTRLISEAMISLHELHHLVDECEKTFVIGITVDVKWFLLTVRRLHEVVHQFLMLLQVRDGELLDTPRDLFSMLDNDAKRLVYMITGELSNYVSTICECLLWLQTWPRRIFTQSRM